MKSLVIFIDYFGAWPEWFPVFLASCAANPTIHWHFHTDCAPDLGPAQRGLLSDDVRGVQAARQ